jgi:hypothetical protein
MPAHYHDDEVIVRSDRNQLDVEIDHHHHHGRSKSPGGHRRAHSAAPPRARYDDEAEYITSRIDERGRMGEAFHGATKDWEIVDVPPGTERVRMDGVGGGATEVTWSKYSGVRRAKFLPDGDTVARAPPVVSRPRERERERETDTRINVQIYDDKKEERPVKEKRSDMWTEITKDLVSRAAIEEMGYEYEETEYFYYILTYLRYVSRPHLASRFVERILTRRTTGGRPRAGQAFGPHPTGAQGSHPRARVGARLPRRLGDGLPPPPPPLGRRI